MCPSLVSADEPPKEEPSDQKSNASINEHSENNEKSEKLPPIEAKLFPVKVIRRSNSNRIYLFEDIENRQPTPGHLLLLKSEDEPVMAFRVLKDYLDEKKIAAKRIKKYGSHRVLEPGDSFSAIEKISNINPAPSADDKADLNELESKEDLRKTLHIKAYDPELDVSSTPHSSSKDGLDEGDEQEDPNESNDTHLAVTVEEVEIMDHNNHWLTAGFGYVRNNGPPATGGSYLFSAGNLRYGYSLGKMVFLDKSHLQDSFVLEAGVYIYKSINFQVQGDAYTLMGISGALRYNVLFSRSLGVFVYAGIIQNNVLTATQSYQDGAAALSSILPVFGGGLLLEMGPSWFLRTDLGYDSITLNLVLRF